MKIVKCGNHCNATIIGMQSSDYEFLKYSLKSEAQNRGLELDLCEVNSTQEIIDLKLERIPAVKVGNKIIERNGASLKKYIDTVHKYLFGSIEAIGPEFIVPVDFSATSDIALELALGMAKKMNGSLHLLHVMPPVPIPVFERVPVSFEQPEKAEKRLQTYLREFLTDRGEATSLRKTSDVRIGLVAEEILALAKEFKNPWVVMGTSGEGGSMKKLIGSSSLSVLQRVRCPLVLVPPRAEVSLPRKIALASTDAKNDAQHLDGLSGFATAMDVQLHLVHVLQKKDSFDSMSLCDMLSNKIPKNKIVVAEIEGKNVTQALSDYCMQQEIDLIVMSPMQRKFIEELFHRSKTRKMALHTTTPLLILK